MVPTLETAGHPTIITQTTHDQRGEKATQPIKKPATNPTEMGQSHKAEKGVVGPWLDVIKNFEQTNRPPIRYDQPKEQRPPKPNRCEKNLSKIGTPTNGPGVPEAAQSQVGDSVRDDVKLPDKSLSSEQEIDQIIKPIVDAYNSTRIRRLQQGHEKMIAKKLHERPDLKTLAESEQRNRVAEITSAMATKVGNPEVITTTTTCEGQVPDDTVDNQVLQIIENLNDNQIVEAKNNIHTKPSTEVGNNVDIVEGEISGSETEQTKRTCALIEISNEAVAAARVFSCASIQVKKPDKKDEREITKMKQQMISNSYFACELKVVNDRPYAPVVMREKWVIHALLDSGSEATLISQEVFDVINSGKDDKDKMKVTEHRGTLQNVNGAAVPIVGLTELALSFGKYRMNQPVTIVDIPGAGVIIGGIA